jgi:hypothetical protein
LYDALKGWWFGESAKPESLPPPPRRDLQREAPLSDPTPPERDRLDDAQKQRRLERQREKERLLDLLRQKREQREQQERDRSLQDR